MACWNISGHGRSEFRMYSGGGASLAVRTAPEFSAQRGTKQTITPEQPCGLLCNLIQQTSPPIRSCINRLHSFRISVLEVRVITSHAGYHFAACAPCTPDTLNKYGVPISECSLQFSHTGTLNFVCQKYQSNF